MSDPTQDCRDAVRMVLDAGTGEDGYDPSDSEICDAIDWGLLRKVAADWVREDFDEWSELTKERDAYRADAEAERPRNPYA